MCIIIPIVTLDYGYITLDLDYAKRSWQTLYGFTRNSLCLLAFFVVLAACIPHYVPGISNERLEQRQEDMQQKLDRLDSIPGDVAVINQKLDTLSARMDRSDQWQNTMTDRLNLWLIGFLAFLSKQVFSNVFGGKLKRRNEDE